MEKDNTRIVYKAEEQTLKDELKSNLRKVLILVQILLQPTESTLDNLNRKGFYTGNLVIIKLLKELEV